MTDNEIIKAFETCYKGYDELLDKVCDILNRQKAEIEKFKKIDRLAQKTIDLQMADIKKLEAEVERLQIVQCSKCKYHKTYGYCFKGICGVGYKKVLPRDFCSAGKPKYEEE